jgi:DNA-3-methyladenine glycosylase
MRSERAAARESNHFGPPLPGSFYDRDPRFVARAVLGKVLVRRWRGKLLAGRIVEVEAYLGVGDLAAHASAGVTSRNRVLFGPPGHAYVYFIYGAYYCLNFSCMAEGDAGCVLVRALEPLTGLELMARNRGIELPRDPTTRQSRALASGPGRLCDALGITRERDNGKDLTTSASDLFVFDDGYVRVKVATTIRIGITKDEHHRLRYVIAGNPFVSG